MDDTQDFLNIVVCKVGIPTETGKIYDRETCQQIVEQAEKMIGSNTCVGFSNFDPCVENSIPSHQITKVWIKERGEGKAPVLKATIKILSTPTGMDLRKVAQNAFWGIHAIGCFVPGTTKVSPKDLRFISIDAYGFDPNGL